MSTYLPEWKPWRSPTRAPMKHLPLFVAALLFALAVLPSCVTAEDLRRVAYSVETLENVAADTTTTTAELEAQVNATKEDIEAVAEEVEDRTKGFVEGIGEGTEGGIVGILAAIGLNLWRNSTRKKALAQVEVGAKPGA